jgi:hypothetical protein
MEGDEAAVRALVQKLNEIEPIIEVSLLNPFDDVLYGCRAFYRPNGRVEMSNPTNGACTIDRA